MQRGTDIHAEVEHYLKTGEIRDSCYSEFNLNYRPYVESLAPLLPPPMHDELIIEHPIELECGPGLPFWIGFIDIGFSGGKVLQIRDTKTTSDFRYAKTEKELSENIQIISYAKWAYEMAGYTGPIDVGHIYIKTEKKLVRKKPKTKEVNLILSQEHVEDVWDREMATVAQMVEAAQVDSAEDLPPTTSHCSKYSGCPFREQCGLPQLSLFGKTTNKGKEQMGNAFLERLKKKSGSAEAPEEAPAPKKRRGRPKKKVEEAIEEFWHEEPEEAPAPKKRRGRPKKKVEEAIEEFEDEEPEEAPAPKKRRGRPKKKVEEVIEEFDGEEPEEAPAPKKRRGRPKKEKPEGLLPPDAPSRTTKTAKAKKAKAQKPFTIYIDCYPKKSAADRTVMLFEDWFSGVRETLNEAAAEKNLASYLLMPYAEEKALVCMAVESALEQGVPDALIVSSGITSAKDALAVLIPHATEVITAIK